MKVGLQGPAMDLSIPFVCNSVLLIDRGLCLFVFAGTVVDSGITHPTESDFFLLSHAGLKGTSRPGHYHTLLDQNGLSTNDIQQFCYKYACLSA